MLEVRDPVHGFIRANWNAEAVINLPIMQRLRRIRQTAMANLVYPGANHTRFEHSLGCMHVAGRLARTLDLPDKETTLVEKAALLHDVGHGPFSHVSEQLLAEYGERQGQGKSSEIHEEITRLLIETDDELERVLQGDKAQVLDLLSKPGVRNKNHDIISGPFDADKLDYLLRDSHYAGVKYGTFDLERIVSTVVALEQGAESYMAIDEDGFWAVEQMLLAKHHMNLQVYRHRIRLITDAMLVRAINMAIRDGQQEIGKLYEFKAERSFVGRYLAWDDETLMRALLRSPSEGARQCALRLSGRHLLKEVYAKHTKEFKDALKRNRIARLSKADLLRGEQRIAELLSKELKLPINPDLVIVNVQGFSNPTFRPAGAAISEGDIIVRMKDGTARIAAEYPNTILGTVAEPEQEMVYVYMPLDELAKEDRNRLVSRIASDISDILENT